MAATGDAVMDLACHQQAQLGEGLCWHPEGGKWWWTDIEASTIHAWSPAAGGVAYRLPERAGSLAHCRSGALLVGLEKRLVLARWPDADPAPQLQTLARVEWDEPRTRVNDGRTDRHGNFVFGTMDQSPAKQPIGSFYQYSRQHGLRRLDLPGVAIANSICFSLDGATMYYTDTLTRCIMQCDYDAPAARVSRQRLFVKVAEPNAWPDGSVVDADGCLWNAQWGAASIVRYAPDGRALCSVAVPAKNPTCPGFGGSGMRTLMVTTARQDMDAGELASMPDAGSLFCWNAGAVRGVADTLFDDDGMNSADE